MRKITANTPAELINNYAPYEVYIDNVCVLTIIGPMAAIGAEIVCQYLEQQNNPITTNDIFQRIKTQNKKPAR